jgi:hypothetical protein
MNFIGLKSSLNIYLIHRVRDMSRLIILISKITSIGQAGSSYLIILYVCCLSEIVYFDKNTIANHTRSNLILSNQRVEVTTKLEFEYFANFRVQSSMVKAAQKHDIRVLIHLSLRDRCNE